MLLAKRYQANTSGWISHFSSYCTNDWFLFGWITIMYLHGIFFMNSVLSLWLAMAQLWVPFGCPSAPFGRPMGSIWHLFCCLGPGLSQVEIWVPSGRVQSSQVLWIATHHITLGCSEFSEYVWQCLEFSEFAGQSGGRKCCSDPHFHMRRGSGWR